MGLSGLLTDRGLSALLAATGMHVVEGCPFAGRVREVYVAGVLGLGSQLTPAATRWLTCHGLGHHLLHQGNHLCTDARVFRQQDAEAEAFASALIFGDTSLEPVAS